MAKAVLVDPKERLQELLVEWEEALRCGREISLDDLSAECPELQPQLRRSIASLQSMYEALDSWNAAKATPDHMLSPTQGLQQIDRYRLERVLGRGGYGTVYLAYDDKLDRKVAIKVPHADRFSTRQDAELFLSEARIVAKLDHPNIVPVYDVSQTEDGRCYVVSKYVAGRDLDDNSADDEWTIQRSTEVVADLADALYCAHSQRIVHRDIKPANIRIGEDGRPYLLDFGIALTDDDFGNHIRAAGTPAYMSPEQALGEGHLVDGRSDIFSLGTVFYELLTGTLPFQGSDWLNTVARVGRAEPRPPRQLEYRLPCELERVCLKALASRASDRYTTAKDMANDLRDYLADSGSDQAYVLPHQRPIRPSTIVPKGLRCFDANDADFFLELLPGPRSRTGLPDSIRFWKTLIETSDPDETFRVGLIYGPSGCGKSSLVRAGLLPRLDDHVLSIYVEASAADTESRLLAGLRKRDLCLSADANLVEALAAIRKGEDLQPGRKLLIVLDQFEQWLHAKRHEVGNTELTRALRQCDGGNVQCIVMVRDDFWMAATRFFRDLDIGLSDGDNSAAVDLFDPLHARKVLALYGQAFSAFPDVTKTLSDQQTAFLNQAIAGLTRDGKVVCVQLSLFAEMVKSKPWTLDTLRDVGGAEGVGVTFLEESFSATGAPPEQRLHQHAARGMLKALLPESGLDIKGSMRSHTELLDASGYARRPQEFERVIQILDRQLRLLTPVEAAELWDANACEWTGGSKEKHYQLTHDYLVPALRAWLTRKQKETRRGRAQLSLAERTAAWSSRPEQRNLPTWPEYAAIQLFTDASDWTPAQRALMRQANRRRLTQCLIGLFLMAGAALLGLGVKNSIETSRKRERAEALVQRLVDADVSNVADIIDELARFREWSHPLLLDRNQSAPATSSQRLHTALALLPDLAQLQYLQQQLLTRAAPEFVVIRNALAEQASELVDQLWKHALGTTNNQQQRFQAACALASYVPADSRWNRVDQFVAKNLVTVLPSDLSVWIDSLRPASAHLIAPLMALYQESQRDEQERLFAVVALAEYSNDVDQLFDLLKHANPRQADVVFSALSAHNASAIEMARQIVNTPTNQATRSEEREQDAKKLAHAAAFLLETGTPTTDYGLIAPRLRDDPEPHVRSVLMHSITPAADHVQVIIDRLLSESEPSIRRGLVFLLGQSDAPQSMANGRPEFTEKLLALYRDQRDPGLHGALEWTLKQWGQADEITSIDQQLATGTIEGERLWYVNREQQTMAVVPGPTEFDMGSPPNEQNRFEYETLHRRRIDRTFAIATKEVTVAQFQRFVAEHASIIRHSYSEEVSPTANCPQTSVTWFLAAHYCNWLSERDGISEDQWCYLPNKEWGHFPNEAHTPNTAEMEFAQNYLSRTGYRLPTEAEWECACRAGTLTKRHYGDADKLLPEYAWYLRNANMRTWPVGQLRPNGLGLFDMHGNVYEWCQTMGQERAKIVDGVAQDLEQTNLLIKPLKSRALKGGCFQDLESDIRSAVRGGQNPGVPNRTVGFRPARTIAPRLASSRFTEATPTREDQHR